MQMLHIFNYFITQIVASICNKDDWDPKLAIRVHQFFKSLCSCR